jgi:cytochrome c-type biogenesis protein CcmH
MRRSRGAPRVRGPVSSAAALLGLLALGGVALLAPQRAARAVDPTQLPDPALQARYSGLTHELRCMQCQNEAIADSPVDLAADLRREVRDMLLAGKSDDDVRNFMAARYGDFILFRPRFAPRTAWLWLAPGVLLLVGVLVSWRVVRARIALVPGDNEPLEEDPSR